MPLFAVVVLSKEVRAFDNSIMTSAGDKFIAVKDIEGWVEATSRRFDGAFPLNAKTFNLHEDAIKFAKRWKGHPWWCVPSGSYEIFEIKPRYRQVMDGYDLA